MLCTGLIEENDQICTWLWTTFQKWNINFSSVTMVTKIFYRRDIWNVCSIFGTLSTPGLTRLWIHKSWPLVKTGYNDLDFRRRCHTHMQMGDCTGDCEWALHVKPYSQTMESFARSMNFDCLLDARKTVSEEMMNSQPTFCVQEINFSSEFRWFFIIRHNKIVCSLLESARQPWPQR